MTNTFFNICHDLIKSQKKHDPGNTIQPPALFNNLFQLLGMNGDITIGFNC